MTTATTQHKIFCRHPDPERQGTNIAQDKYDAMRAALLRRIPLRAGGVPFRGLKDAIAPLLPDDVFAGASISWYLTTVVLDLEARGLIERVPGHTRLHLRRRRRS